jgi:hypothetical protein
MGLLKSEVPAVSPLDGDVSLAICVTRKGSVPQINIRGE